MLWSGTDPNKTGHYDPQFHRIIDHSDERGLPHGSSFLPEAVQWWIYDASEEYKFRLNMKTAKLFRDEGEALTETRVREIANELTQKDKYPTTYQKVMIPKITYKKYFKDMDDRKVQAIIAIALEKYFKEQNPG